MTARIDRIWPDPAEQLHDDELMDAVDHEAVRLNFVSSIDGAATRDGRSGGLGGPADKRYFDLLRRVADVVVAGGSRVDAALAVDALRARGLRRILCEGGPTLFGSVLAADVADELCLTVSPTLEAGDAPRIANGDSVPREMTLASVLRSGSTLLLRYVRATR